MNRSQQGGWEISAVKTIKQGDVIEIDTDEVELTLGPR